MSVQFRLPRPVSVPALKRAGPLAAALVAALLLVPSASSGNYTDPSGDSGAAGDITGISVIGDKTSGQLVFTIAGSNLASSGLNPLFLTIDSDSNPLTGDLTDHGTDYWFGMDDTGYGFQHWTGSDWVDTSSLSVQIRGNTSSITISVNRSELGNSSTFNFYASTFYVLGSQRDSAPNDGAFNYSFDTNGPRIDGVDVLTTPAAGPRAGKRFVVKPSALKLPPDGRTSTTAILPESYSCRAKLGARALAGQSVGRCTFAIPKKKSKGKRLTVQLTVTYEGATKTVPLTFKVG
jgi:hypothetical protein